MLYDYLDGVPDYVRGLAFFFVEIAQYFRYRSLSRLAGASCPDCAIRAPESRIRTRIRERLYRRSILR